MPTFKAGQKVNGKRYHNSIYYVANRIRKAPVVAVVGRQGNGKSITGLELARILHDELDVCDGSFNPETNLIYDVLELHKRFKTAERQALIFDEAANTLNKKDYNSPMNRGVDRLINTQRRRENVVIFILPKFADLDKALKGHVDAVFWMIKTGIAKVYRYRYKYHKDGTARSITSQPPFSGYWKVPMPPKDLVEAYREKEVAFKEGVADANIKQIKREKQKLQRIY